LSTFIYNNIKVLFTGFALAKYKVTQSSQALRKFNLARGEMDDRAFKPQNESNVYVLWTHTWPASNCCSV